MNLKQGQSLTMSRVLKQSETLANLLGKILHKVNSNTSH